MMPGGLTPPYISRNTTYTYSCTGTLIAMHPTPERLFRQQMRMLKEHWAGVSLALNLRLKCGDMGLAGAHWRNVHSMCVKGTVFLGTKEVEGPKTWCRQFSIILMGATVF